MKPMFNIFLTVVAITCIAWLGIRLNRSMGAGLPATRPQLVGYENAKRLEPWTVVCDEQSGKFTFRDLNTIWIEEFDSREAAEAQMRILKRQEEELQSYAISTDEHARINAIWSKDWKACNKPSSVLEGNEASSTPIK